MLLKAYRTNHFLNRINVIFVGMLISFLLIACPVYAGQVSAHFILRPQKVTQESQVWYEVIYKQGTNSTAAAAFYLGLPNGASGIKVEAGKDVQASEVSYDVKENQLVLLYLDDDVGETMPPQGGQLFRICLENISADQPPFVLNKLDVCTLAEDGEIVQVDATLMIQSTSQELQEKPIQNATSMQLQSGGIVNDSSEQLNQQKSEHSQIATENTPKAYSEISQNNTVPDTTSDSNISKAAESAEDAQNEIPDESSGLHAASSEKTIVGINRITTDQIFHDNSIVLGLVVIIILLPISVVLLKRYQKRK